MDSSLMMVTICILNLLSVGPELTTSFDFTVDCGKVPRSFKPLIAHGTTEKVGDSPWQAAVYQKQNSKNILICGGTIISAYIIVSAAHCFYNDARSELNDKTSFEIMVAKVTRDYSTYDTDYQKNYKVEEIRIPPEYFGATTNYAADIALLIVAKRIQFNSLVFPACFELYQPEFIVSDGSIGKLSGWGKDSHDELTENLQTANLTFFEYKSCVKLLPPEDKQLIALDKICSNNTHESGARQGDSGSGYLFLRPNTVKYYLRGVVSIKIDLNPATLFTNAMIYSSLVRRIVKETENKKIKNEVQCTLPKKRSFNGEILELICSSYIGLRFDETIPETCRIVIKCSSKPNPVSSTCTNGAWKPRIASVCSNMSPMDPCGIVNEKRHVEDKSASGDGHLAKENWPWLVTFINGTESICMGSLIAKNWILTTAYCAKKISDLNIKSAHLGDLHLNNDYDGTNPVDIPIENTIMHSKYQNYHFNIALVRLKISVTFSKFIFPICLIENAEQLEFEASTKQGIFVDRFSSEEQSEVKVDILDYQKCFNTNKTSSGYPYVDSEMCVDFCWGYSGSPFTIYNNETENYFLIGQKSQGLPSKNDCTRSKGKIFYTKISYFYDWIKNIINE